VKIKQMKQFVAMLGLASLFNLAAAEAGRVLVAVGDVSALRAGKPIALAAGAAIESGDTLRTGATSNAQVRMTDGSIVALRPQTEFRLDEYRFAGKADGSEKGFFSLVKGGFRTITGAIGKGDHENYKVTTATAVIGVRGTDYTLVQCAQDCSNPDGSKAKDGLYGSVTDGRINAANQGGGKDFARGEAFFVADAHTAPQGIVVPPGFLSDKLAARSRNQNRQGQEGAKAEEKALSTDARPAAVETAAAVVPTVQTSTTAPVASFVAAEAVNATGTSSVLPVGNYVEVQTAYAFSGSSNVNELCNGGGCDGTLNISNGIFGSYSAPSYAINSGGSLTDTGSAAVDSTTVYWGRWTNASVTDPWNSGTPPTGLHFVATGGGAYGSCDPAVIAAKSGPVTYSFVNGTHATDTNGNIGTKMSGSLGIDFTARTITPNITYAVGGSTYNVTGFSIAMPAGQIGLNSDSSANGTGSCTGGVCGGGRPIDYVVMNTTFVGRTGGGVIAGVSTAMTSVSPVSTAAVGLFKAP
jgi:hypothetical protein